MMANEHEHGGGLPHLVCAHKGKVVMGTNHYRYQHLLESDASFPAHRGDGSLHSTIIYKYIVHKAIFEFCI